MGLLNKVKDTDSRMLKNYAKRLEKLGIFRIEDFLYHLPSRYEDYSVISKIGNVQPGEVVTIQGEVVEAKNQYLRSSRIKTIQKAVIHDETGNIELTWFNQPFIIKSLTAGNRISASGRVEGAGNRLKLQSPVYEILPEGQESVHTGRLVPVYPETKGVSSKWLRRQIFRILQDYKHELIEFLPPQIISAYKLLPLAYAIQETHYPKNLTDAEKARERIGFDELFLLQLASLKRRAEWRQVKVVKPLKIKSYDIEINNFYKSLPFRLTGAQDRSVGEILKDLESDKPMNRLLQGDVGSGKTVVAAAAMYAVYLNGFQSILLAPTGILAQQHYLTIKVLLEKFNIKVDLVTGTSNQKKIKVQKSKIKTKNENNKKYDILIGTHALLNEKVKPDKLALVVIDEQQRFGVEQRSLIRQKGESTHLLTMTATPIPRTVALTMYGDLDLSYLDEMPVGRQKIKTWLVPPEKREAGYRWIEDQIRKTDSQAFIICPFIEQSESMITVKAASIEYERLKTEVFPALKIGLLHGKMKAVEKDSVMQDFKNKKYDILVATPVVEVGIDVSNATIIMIEAADRFGLAQLHQLRGRVGRGDKQSYCLLYSDSQTEKSLERLKSLEKTHSGAELAELDLKLRGPGDIYGTAQHGIPRLKAASFSDSRLIQTAGEAAKSVFPGLKKYPLLQEKVKNIRLENVSPD